MSPGGKTQQSVLVCLGVDSTDLFPTSVYMRVWDQQTRIFHVCVVGVQQQYVSVLYNSHTVMWWGKEPTQPLFNTALPVPTLMCLHCVCVSVHLNVHTWACCCIPVVAVLLHACASAVNYKQSEGRIHQKEGARARPLSLTPTASANELHLHPSWHSKGDNDLDHMQSRCVSVFTF